MATPPKRVAAERPIERSAVDRAADQADLGILSRGRIWIAAFAIGLAGLVFLQSELRSLNSGIGTSVQAITKLERDNAVLRSQISSLSSDQRIYAEARRMGFVEPPVGSSKYLYSSRGDAGRALLAMTAPTSQAPLLADSGTAGVDGAAAGVSDVTVDPSGGDGTVEQPTTDSGAQATTAAVPDSAVDGSSDTSGG